MTAKFLSLKQITDEVAEPPHPDEVLGEDDAIAPAAQLQAGDARSALSRSGRWKPMTIAVDSIRNYYPRAGGNEGTRVLMKSGVAYIVLNEVAEINRALGADLVDLTGSTEPETA